MGKASDQQPVKCFGESKLNVDFRLCRGVITTPTLILFKGQLSFKMHDKNKDQGDGELEMQDKCNRMLTSVKPMGCAMGVHGRIPFVFPLGGWTFFHHKTLAERKEVSPENRILCSNTEWEAKTHSGV